MTTTATSDSHISFKAQFPLHCKDIAPFLKALVSIILLWTTHITNTEPDVHFCIGKYSFNKYLLLIYLLQMLGCFTLQKDVLDTVQTLLLLIKQTCRIYGFVGLLKDNDNKIITACNINYDH